MDPVSHRTFYKAFTDHRGREIGRVRGLTPCDMDWLFQAHEDSAEAVYESWSAQSESGVPGLILAAVQDFPEMVADIIALASDSPDFAREREVVAGLPARVRRSALAHIMSMTFGSEGGLDDVLRRRDADTVPEDAAPHKPARGRPVARFLMTVRKTVSLLLERGHRDAARQPLGRIFTEVEIVRDRIERTQANDAVLMQKTVGSLIDEKIGRDFSKWIREMARDGD